MYLLLLLDSRIDFGTKLCYILNVLNRNVLIGIEVVDWRQKVAFILHR